MPELPEVEVVRRGLEMQIVGKTIAEVAVRGPAVVVNEPEWFAARLRGQHVVAARRRAKYLLLDISSGDTLVVHLRMTGQLTYHDRSAQERVMVQPATYLERALQVQPIDKHTHVVVTFEDGNGLYYRDSRKFGRLQLCTPAELATHKGLLKLGVEPLTEAFTLPLFRRFLKGNRSIKAVLLDQTLVAGIGNIYCDEALFLAGIRPQRGVTELSKREQERLFKAIPEVLHQGIAYGGTTLKDFLQADGQQGSNQEELWVYGRSGEPCRRCGTPLTKTVVAQRGTHFCGQCQR